jgi:hypothetical protein
MHPDLRRRVRLALVRTRVVPESGKPLMGELAGWWSVRVGRLRIVYRSTRTRLDVATIGPRASIYEEAARLLRRRR